MLSPGLENLDAGFKAVTGFSLIESATAIINDDRNYRRTIESITYKGKNRTFKKKTSRKRVLHKGWEFDQFNAMLNTMNGKYKHSVSYGKYWRYLND